MVLFRALLLGVHLSRNIPGNPVAHWFALHDGNKRDSQLVRFKFVGEFSAIFGDEFRAQCLDIGWFYSHTIVLSIRLCIFNAH